MILSTVRHGRSGRDVRNLKAHLSAQIDQVSRVVEIGSVGLSHADDALAYMEAMRDGSRATVAMHHISISPLHRLDDAQRDEAVRRVLSAMGAEDHAWVLWEHEGKARSERAADQHFHLVVGHVGPDGKALDDSMSYFHLEAAARSLEHDFGEPFTPSRRTTAVAAILRENGRSDVADRLVPPDEPPRSATSSGRRAAAAREGVDLPKAQAAVRAAWAAADSSAAFRAALAEQGFEVAPGTKAGVWIVRSGETEIGALDRITREKRAAVSARMEVHHVPEASVPADPVPAPRDDEPGRVRRDVDAHRGAEASPPPGPPRGAGERPVQPDRGDQGSPRGRAAVAAPAPHGGGRREQPARHARRAAEAIAVHRLRRVPDARLKALAADLRQVARASLDRVRDALVGRRAAALRRRDAPPSIPTAPAVLVALRTEIDAAWATSRAVFYDRASELGTAQKVVELPEPAGLLDRVTGRRAQWSRDRQQAAALLDAAERTRSEAHDLAGRLQRRALPLERQYGRDVKAAEDRARDDRRAAERELVVVTEALRLLSSEPGLARLGEDGVLAEAERRLDSTQRERERHARAFQPRDEVSPAYSGPRR